VTGPRPGEAEQRRRLAAAARRLHERGLVAAAEGNLSLRLSGGGWLVTPSGRCKGELGPRDAVRIDAAGGGAAGRRSSEWPLHAAVYRCWPEAVAVVHAHPPTATGFACTARGLDPPLLPEVVQALGGSIPLVPWAPPGGEELALAARPFLRAKRRALLLANHGALSVSERSLEDALLQMEQIEQVAAITFVARRLGDVRELTAAQLAQVRPLR